MVAHFDLHVEVELDAVPHLYGAVDVTRHKLDVLALQSKLLGLLTCTHLATLLSLINVRG